MLQKLTKLLFIGIISIIGMPVLFSCSSKPDPEQISANARAKDSIELIRLRSKVDQLKKDFTYESLENISSGSYMHNRFVNQPEYSTLLATVVEGGGITLSSQYYGDDFIYYEMITARTNDSKAYSEKVPASQGNNYNKILENGKHVQHIDFLGLDGEDKVLELISKSERGDKIFIKFNGKYTSPEIELPEEDRIAIKESAVLAATLFEIQLIKDRLNK